MSESILIRDLDAAVAEYRRRAGILSALLEAARAAFEAGDAVLAGDLLTRASQAAQAMAEAGGARE